MIIVLAKQEGRAELYFKQARKYGGVECVAFWTDAARFSSKASALECARTHPELKDSDTWRAVQVTERCERTR